MATREQISAQAHNRRVNEEMDRLSKKLNVSVERVIKKCEEFEERLSRDPFRAIKLRTNSHGKFVASPWEVEAGLLNITIDALADPSGALNHREEFDPIEFRTSHVVVEPIDLVLTPWGTLLSIRFENLEVSRHLNLRLVKKSSPAESSVYLIDTDNNAYYYPVATDLSGDIVAGHPRIGIIVFEPFREVTSVIALHFSGLKLSPVRGQKETFSFSCRDECIGPDTEALLETESFTRQMRRIADAKGTELLAEIEETRTKSLVKVPQSGCLIALLVFPFLLLREVWSGRL